MAVGETHIYDAAVPLDRSELSHITTAWQQGLLVLDNHSVNAFCGNAYDESIQSHIAKIKGGNRGALQPLGWAHSFEQEAIEVMDTTTLPDDAKELVSNGVRLQQLLGGICFVRTPANMVAKNDLKIPGSIIPSTPDATVQVYDPAGVSTTEAIVTHAQENGILTVMTSANQNSEPETVDRKTGEVFLAHARAVGEVAVTGVFFDHAMRPTKSPRGSYPIIELNENGIELKRAGCFAVDVLRRILNDYTITRPIHCTNGNYPYDSLHLADLSSDTASLTGPALRNAILRDIGWQIAKERE